MIVNLPSTPAPPPSRRLVEIPKRQFFVCYGVRPNSGRLGEPRGCLYYKEQDGTVTRYGSHMGMTGPQRNYWINNDTLFVDYREVDIKITVI
jgi:hypothetical protein